MALVLGHDFGTSKPGTVAENFRLVNSQSHIAWLCLIIVF
jgi:hypothetical protein